MFHHSSEPYTRPARVRQSGNISRVHGDVTSRDIGTRVLGLDYPSGRLEASPLSGQLSY